MKISNFDHKISQVILERGIDYFEDGAVCELRHPGPGSYVARVIGSNDYQVSVELNGEDIIHSFCDCPYDKGPVCKHEVAVYLAIQEYLKRMESCINDQSIPVQSHEETGLESNSTIPGNHSDLARLVKNSSREELESALLEFACIDPMNASRLFLMLGQPDIERQSDEWASMIRRHLHQYCGRRRSFNDSSIFSAMQGANEVNRMAVTFMHQNRWEHAFFAALKVYTEMVSALSWADGWDETHEMINDCINIMTIAAPEMKPEELARCLDALREAIQNTDFGDYDEYALEALCLSTAMASTGQQAQTVGNCANSFMARQNNNSGISCYGFESLHEALYAMYLRLGESSQALKLRQNKAHLAFFRRLSIEEAISADNLSEAAFLCREAMKADENLPGLAAKWEETLADIYQKSGQLKEWRMIMRARAIKGDWNCYLDFKQSFTDPEWILQQRAFVDELRADFRGCHLYPHVLINECLLDELLAYVKANPALITSYAGSLCQYAPAEVKSLYEAHVIQMSEQASKRSHYRELAREIGNLARYSTSAGAQEIRDHILKQHPRRPALHEELKKIPLQ